MPIRTPEERVGTVLAERYRLDRIIGQGGMGVVYAGVHTFTGKAVAVKVLLHQALESQAVRKRFFQEAKAGGSLSHPNVIKIFDSGEDQNGDPYIAMELLEGESLSSYAQGTIPVGEALSIVVSIVDALRAAHEAGIIHRDIKPGNIFLQQVDEGVTIPKLLDFGVVKLMSSRRSLTNTGVVMGTPYYLSPEQAGSGAQVGPTTDVWATGVLLLRLVAGVRPFDADEPARMIVKVATLQLPPCQQWASEIPDALALVIDRCLRLDPEERFSSMQELGQALVFAGRSLGIALDSVPTALEPEDGATPPQSFEGDQPEARQETEESPRGRRRAVAGILIAGLVLGAGGWWFADSAEPAPGDGEFVVRQLQTIPPGASALVNGEDVGITPISLRVSPNRSTPVRLVKQGYFPAEVFVASTDPEVIRITLRNPEQVATEAVVARRTLISDPPGAVVSVSGQVRGRAPIDLDVDSEVSLEVLMTLDGYWPQTVYLSASDPDEVEVTLRPRL